ncbi:MAG: aminotransferase class I/II-fold pyridoxal phosphate-dependent enzyme [bacterium]
MEGSTRLHPELSEVLAKAPASRLSRYAEAVEGSSILRIAGDIREMAARGDRVLNLTVGDFRPDQFPVPARYRGLIEEALAAGETNYPPVAGVQDLRAALRDHLRLDFGLDYPLESFFVAGGARPLLYSAYMALVDPGDLVLYPVPSWNNHHYVRMSGGRGVPLPVTPEKNFHLDRDDLAPYLKQARLLCLNSPLNPTGTCIKRAPLTGICEAIVEENVRRAKAGEAPLWLVYDQVYHSQVFGRVEHHTPVGLVPEIAPWTVLLDAVSKGFCGTGLRVGWAAAAPKLIAKMAELAGHYGAWAPRPEQVALARFLRDRDAVHAHRRWMIEALEARLGLIHESLVEMQAAGLPVDFVEPQGAIYLSVRFDLAGKTVAGRTIRSNEDLRQALLFGAGFAVVPFEAFGLEGPAGDGWVRVSVGAVSVDEIREGMARVRKLLEEAR